VPNRSKLWRQLDEYWQTLQDSALAERSIEDYYYFAECFVRWTEGTFEPGAQLKVKE
jgi:hypothetical protein